MGTALVLLCAAVLCVSCLPLYAISLFNHPYYDDFGFSAATHSVWQSTGSLGATLAQAVESAKEVRQSWQGTYTGTLLSNLQPGMFSERLYFIGTFVLLTAFIACFVFLIYVLLSRVFTVDGRAAACLACLATALMAQLMPDAGEAFFWFNGGIGNVFIYSLLALSLALSYYLISTAGRVRAALLAATMAALMVLLGGGSYGGGLFGLCLYALITLYLFVKKHRRKWVFLALWALFLACFLYSAAAPGNVVRAWYIQSSLSPVSAIAWALYYGMAQIGSYIRLPIIALSLLFLPAIYAAARRSEHSFSHPWLVTLAIYLLYCTQLVPPLYAGVGIGAGRIVNTYFISFTVLWLVWLCYITGYAAKRLPAMPSLTKQSARGLALVCAALMLTGCLGFRRDSDKLPGVQNLTGVSAAISLVNGEAQSFHREMSAREALLNDASKPTITLSPVVAQPAVFMKDLITPDTTQSVLSSLRQYYGKDVILIEGSEVEK